MGRGRGRMGRKRTRNKKHNWEALDRWREVKNGIGNRELKELLCTSHGHELRGGEAEGLGVAEWKGN